MHKQLRFPRSCFDALFNHWSFFMHQIIISFQEASVAALPLIPVFGILDQKFFHNRRKSLVYLIFSIYLATMYAAAGLPDITYYRFHPHYNLKPFLYMFTALETTWLNVLLFMPFGFFLPLLWKRYGSFFRTLLAGFSVSLFIEGMQIFTYRASDINDLITNTLGTILGYCIGRIILLLFSEIRPEESNRDIVPVFSVSFAVMFFLYPFLSKIFL